ncbi:putative L-amino-acid oxidase precursor [Podospora aff. communis PSN243]|uniref:L-amino-acid oxidase n=1 Tax=Podospora aff. communis PSN243 TaxID=3040156 RepID=A0AAV9GQF8_9PEZI|nr:putative L-amino-acid oxidase precursor [Podospora aff. communis PSN243]
MTTPSIKARWAQRLVREKLAAELNAIQERRPLGAGHPTDDHAFLPHLGQTGRFTWDNLPPDHPRLGDGRDGALHGDYPPRKVCIVGAGVAGLYIAMLLDSLNIPNLTYDILEANPDRVGGRCYTYRFSDDPHDYYDIGAMRYPDIPTMQRTFDLFKLTKMPLIPYYLTGPKNPNLFNDRFFADGPDPYHVSVSNGGSVPNDVVDNVSAIFDCAFGPYKKAMAEDFDKGFEALMKVDDFSTREFLKRGGPDGTLPKYDFSAIQWLETQDTSTNLFDQAFSESVMDSFDFDNPQPVVNWWCIEGGTSLLTDAMQARLTNGKVETNKRVDAILWDSTHREKEDNMSVKCADEDSARTGYCTVFNTAALGCLGRMDLRTLELHPSQKDAIRSLHYDESVKVALKFSYPWWIVDCGITTGGVASTDIPLRTCVYPSYNIHDDPTKPAVLLASYTWAQDATRMGSLVNGRLSPEGEEQLVELILRELALLHAQTTTYDKIRAAFTGVHHAYSWPQDPTTAGAFALFGPGQFSNLYPYLTRPAADSKFHIVGEASSAHHAWIVGALDSAFAAVSKFIKRFDMGHKLQQQLEDQWGSLDELETGETGTMHLQVAMGMLPKENQFKV